MKNRFKEARESKSRIIRSKEWAGHYVLDNERTELAALSLAEYIQDHMPEFKELVEAGEFWKEYFEQDNHCTAYPIYFQIQDVKWVSSYHFEDGERYTLVDDGESYLESDTLMGLFEQIKKDEDDLGFKLPDFLDIDMHISEAECEEFTSINEFVTGIFAEKKGYEYKNMFLLQSEAEAHLKANHYHYSSEAIIYCNHAWRAPKQEAVITKAANSREILKNLLGRLKDE